MSARPGEVTQPHARLLRSGLDVEDARAYWRHASGEAPATAEAAFLACWFGARSLARVEDVVAAMRWRYDAFPPALAVLHAWTPMAPDTRTMLCHWHLQLSDPLYRAFTGDFLVARRDSHRPAVTRDQVLAWATEQGADRWAMATRLQYASKLLSAAHAAGLVATNRDPRPLVVPRVSDEALMYLLYMLRGLDFSGALLTNPYLASVGLTGATLEGRLRSLPALRFQRQGDVIEWGWHYPDLLAWAVATVAAPDRRALA